MPQDSLDSFAGSSEGMAARAKDWGTPARAARRTGKRRSGRRTSMSCSSRSRRMVRGSRRRSSAPGRRTGSCRQGLRRSGARTATRCPPRREPFGFRDGISHPAIEGSGIPGTNPQEQPLKAGEFVLGYPDEMGGIQRTQPEILGRNGTYVVFRKLHQRVAAFRST